MKNTETHGIANPSIGLRRSLPVQLAHLSQLLRLREQLAAFEDDFAEVRSFEMPNRLVDSDGYTMNEHGVHV